MIQQLVYTSGKRLLDAGRSGFGTVARSKSLSSLAVGTIERFSQFANLRGYDRSRLIFAHRRVQVGNSQFHLLTSIRDAGSDYTGRTNHIAHHLIVSSSDARSLRSAGVNPADILGGFAWMTAWSGSPKMWDDSDAPDLSSLTNIRRSGGREAWSAVTGNPLHARLLADSGAPRTGVIIVPESTQPLPLMAEALDETDNPWDLSFTTCLEHADELADFRWVVAPAALSGPVKERCASRVLYDLRQPDQLPVPEENVAPEPEPLPTSGQSASTPETASSAVSESAEPQQRRPVSQGAQIKVRVAGGSDDRARPGRNQVPASSPKWGWLIGGITAVLVLFAGLATTVFLKKKAEPSPVTAGEEAESFDWLDDYVLNEDDRRNIEKHLVAKTAKPEVKADNLKFFFGELIPFLEEPTWNSLNQLETPARTAWPSISWLDGLLGGGQKDKGIPKLKSLAEDLRQEPGSKDLWNQLDEQLGVMKGLNRSVKGASSSGDEVLFISAIIEFLFLSKLNEKQLSGALGQVFGVSYSEHYGKALLEFLGEDSSGDRRRVRVVARAAQKANGLGYLSGEAKSLVEKVAGGAIDESPEPGEKKKPKLADKEESPTRPVNSEVGSEKEKNIEGGECYFLLPARDSEEKFSEELDFLRSLLGSSKLKNKSDLKGYQVRDGDGFWIDDSDAPENWILETSKGSGVFRLSQSNASLLQITSDWRLVVPHDSIARKIRVKSGNTVAYFARSDLGSKEPLWGKASFSLEERNGSVFITNKLAEKLTALNSSLPLSAEFVGQDKKDTKVAIEGNVGGKFVLDIDLGIEPKVDGVETDTVTLLNIEELKKTRKAFEDQDRPGEFGPEKEKEANRAATRKLLKNFCKEINKAIRQRNTNIGELKKEIQDQEYRTHDFGNITNDQGLLEIDLVEKRELKSIEMNFIKAIADYMESTHAKVAEKNADAEKAKRKAKDRRDNLLGAKEIKVWAGDTLIFVGSR